MSFAVEANLLTKQFGQVRALDGVSFNIKPGEIYGLIGPNGAGKTTTLRIVCTLIKPTTGTITIFDQDATKQPEKTRQIISYLPEESGAYPNLTGLEYLKFMAKLQSTPETNLKATIGEAVEICGLGDRLKDKAKTYSKGMKRRLLVARTLMTHPKLAVLDEPASGLDVLYAYHIREIIKRYVKEHGVTVLLSSHNMLEVEYLCNRVALVNKGKLVVEGEPKALITKYNSENLEEVLQRWLALLKGFTTILIKELKELMRDPKILIGMIVLPLIMFPVLGLVMGYAVQTAQTEAQRTTLLVIDNDCGNWSQVFVGYLNSSINVHVVNNTSPQSVIDQGMLAHYNSSTFLVIPAGFSDNLTRHNAGEWNVTGVVNTYGVFNGGGGIFSGVSGSTVDAVVAGFNRAVAPDVVSVLQSSVIKGTITEGISVSALSSLLLTQSIALPITIMVMLTYSMQIAATSVAMEKEEKTLETLLTTPVDRFAILMGKVSSTIIVAGVAAVTVLIGYNYMIGSLSVGIAGVAGGSVDLVALGLVPSVGGYALLGISLFFTLLSALALAVVMSAFSENVRGAQALVGYIYPLIFLPAMALIYLDVNSLPLAIKAVFYAIPYSHPILAAKAVVTGDYGTVVFGIVYVAIFTIVIMYIASRLFATEKILTAKLSFGKGKTKKHSE